MVVYFLFIYRKAAEKLVTDDKSPTIILNYN